MISSTFLLGSTRHNWTCFCIAEFTQHTVNDIHSIEEINNCKKHTRILQLFYTDALNKTMKAMFAPQ